MYAIVGFVCYLALATTALADDTVLNSVSDNDFVQIETFTDYAGDIVPYVSDPYIEDNMPNDVVEEITVNQTVVDNSEVLDRMDKLDNQLTLMNENFESILTPVPPDVSDNDLTSDISDNDPSVNISYPQEVIDDVHAMQKQLVTLTGVTLLNLIIPMFVSVFKRMVDPFKKRRED